MILLSPCSVIRGWKVNNKLTSLPRSAVPRRAATVRRRVAAHPKKNKSKIIPRRPPGTAGGRSIHHHHPPPGPARLVPPRFWVFFYFLVVAAPRRRPTPGLVGNVTQIIRLSGCCPAVCLGGLILVTARLARHQKLDLLLFFSK